MNLTTHYDAMRQAAWPLLAQGQPDLASLLDAPRDDRRGIQTAHSTIIRFRCPL